jgi:acetylornithine deacetylase/succinyl-diaminopimelate desuccinylase-like protein
MTQCAERMARLDEMRDKPVQDLIELVRIPTVNPPGEHAVGRTPEGSATGSPLVSGYEKLS